VAFPSPPSRTAPRSRRPGIPPPSSAPSSAWFTTTLARNRPSLSPIIPARPRWSRSWGSIRSRWWNSSSSSRTCSRPSCHRTSCCRSSPSRTCWRCCADTCPPGRRHERGRPQSPGRHQRARLHLEHRQRRGRGHPQPARAAPRVRPVRFLPGPRGRHQGRRHDQGLRYALEPLRGVALAGALLVWPRGAAQRAATRPARVLRDGTADCRCQAHPRAAGRRRHGSFYRLGRLTRPPARAPQCPLRVQRRAHASHGCRAGDRGHAQLQPWPALPHPRRSLRLRLRLRVHRARHRLCV